LPSAGAGLAFTNKLATDGTIEVITSGEPAGPPRLTINKSGNSVNISWPIGYTTFTLRGQTNATGIANNWGPVPGVTGNQVTLEIDPANKVSVFELIQQ
jgi:hypothetical protein